MTPERFVKELRTLDFVNAFNPYSARCAIHDIDDAPRVRSELLLTILEEATKVEVDSIWLGRDLGYRGGRRTGLALTDDVHIFAHMKRWHISAERPTKGEAVAERTAAVIWSVLSRIEAPVFLWNVFPLHPHESGDPFSNRSHNSRERDAGEELLSQLIFLLGPRRIVAIGNDATQSALRVAGKLKVSAVRHPSYGGQTRFLHQIQQLYRLDGAGQRQESLLSGQDAGS